LRREKKRYKKGYNELAVPDTLCHQGIAFRQIFLFASDSYIQEQRHPAMYPAIELKNGVRYRIVGKVVEKKKRF